MFNPIANSYCFQNGFAFRILKHLQQDFNVCLTILQTVFIIWLVTVYTYISVVTEPK